MLLLIDNYDSVVYNLARYFEELGIEVEVVRNDAMSVEEVIGRGPEAIVLSPGPCGPDNAGISIALVREVLGRIPLMGVCLGHQAIGAAYGARIVRVEPCHGKSAEILHDGEGLFDGIPNRFSAGRYHSLAVCEEGLPAGLEVSARTEDGLIMALRHKVNKVCGIQFHPESVLTEHGHPLLEGFLRLAGIDALRPARETA